MKQRERERERERERKGERRGQGQSARRRRRRRATDGQTDMDDNVRNGLQAEQWLPMFEKGEKRANSLGSGAFRFIRTRSSIRRELKRQCNR